MENWEEKKLLNDWLEIGKNNPWIKYACDPPFRLQSLVKCASPESLEHYLAMGNWCLGQGFYYQNLCFINQINGGDEWLTIKDNYSFESITFLDIIKRGEFMHLIQSLLAASKEECINLTYNKGN